MKSVAASCASSTKEGNGENPSDAFYVAIFDVDKITRPDMDAETDGVMTAVYLKEVVDDYYGTAVNGGREVKHRLGCSGIDGISFGPAFGAPKGEQTPPQCRLRHLRRHDP